MGFHSHLLCERIWICVCVFRDWSAVILVTNQAEGRRYTVHAGLFCELLRQKNKYCQKRRVEESVSVWSQGAAEWSSETDESSCFRNLNAPLLRSSNMCLCVAAITQFQVLALCVHISLCNPTHLSDDVRLALSVRLGLCLYVCVYSVWWTRCLVLFFGQ